MPQQKWINQTVLTVQDHASIRTETNDNKVLCAKDAEQADTDVAQKLPTPTSQDHVLITPKPADNKIPNAEVKQSENDSQNEDHGSSAQGKSIAHQSSPTANKPHLQNLHSTTVASNPFLELKSLETTQRT